MGVLFDYFSASSDEVATTAINRIGWPSQPSEGAPPLPAFDTLHTTPVGRGGRPTPGERSGLF
jgi:hypothetical protein